MKRTTAEKLQTGAQIALLVALGIYAFAPSLSGGWLWDDDTYITHNPLLRGLSGLGKIWFAPPGANYFPVTATVQWVQWHWWQEQTLGYHATNVALHLLSACLIWRLVARLVEREGGRAGNTIGYVAGILFAIHPVAVESVAWISEIKNTLSLPFLLLAFSAYLDYDRLKAEPEPDGHPRRSLFLSVSWFLLAMLCKSTVVMFPATLLLYALWRRGRLTWRDGRATAPFFAIALCLGVLTIWFERTRAIGLGPLPAHSVLARLAVAGLAVPFYWCKCVFPAGLITIYPRWFTEPPTAVQFLPWVLMGVGAFWLWRLRRHAAVRHVLFGLGWFLLNLLPILGFLPMSYHNLAWVADHFVYLPLVGLVALAAVGLETYVLSRPAGWFALAPLVAILAVASHREASDYHSTEVLWADNLRHNPGAWTAHNNLGLALAGSGRVAEAMAHFEAALSLRPDYVEALNNLGRVLHGLGRLPEAIAHFERALRLQPRLAEAHNNLGAALTDAGRPEAAVPHYRQALALKPDFSDASYNLGFALSHLGRTAEASVAYRNTLNLDPHHLAAHYNLALLLSDEGRMGEALDHFDAVIHLRPGFADGHYGRGLALAHAGRSEEAIAEYQETLRLKPENAEAYNALGVAFATTDRLPEAIVQYRAALRIDPQLASARANLGRALASSGAAPGKQP